MTIISAADFALHVQDYLERTVQGEEIRVNLRDGRLIALIAEPMAKQYTKADWLKQLSYQGIETDSQQIDESIYY